MVFDNGDNNRSNRNADTSDSRRQFLAGTGALGALALGGAFTSPTVLADEHNGDADETEGEPPTERVNEGAFEDDVDILNYALTLEYLEYEFYRQGLDNIDEDDLEVLESRAGSDDSGHSDDSITSYIYEQLEVVRDHEETHVEVLSATIEDLGGDPVDQPEFEFGSAVEDPAEFIAVAATLEDTGVAAYAGAAPEIENEGLVPPALSIHSVEARHASFLRELNGEIGFPEAFDDPLPRDEVEAAASQFIADETDGD